MSDTGQPNALKLAINVFGENNQPSIQYVTNGEFVRPDGHAERMAWVRKSYERFLQKVLEKEASADAALLDFS